MLACVRGGLRWAQTLVALLSLLSWDVSRNEQLAACIEILDLPHYFVSSTICHASFYLVFHVFYVRCSSQAQDKKDDKTMRMARSPRVQPGTNVEQTLIISIITSLKWTELIMKGVRR